jgi:hypothetical protein
VERATEQTASVPLSWIRSLQLDAGGGTPEPVQPLHPFEVSYLQRLKVSPNDFDCLDLPDQAAFFVGYLFQRGDSAFAAQDVAGLFAVADMTSPRSGKPTRPSARVVADLLAAASDRSLYRPSDGEHYTLPRARLHQDWLFHLRTPSRNKAERTADRLNGAIGGRYPFVPRLERQAPDQDRCFRVSTPLRSVTWPCKEMPEGEA